LVGVLAVRVRVRVRVRDMVRDGSALRLTLYVLYQVALLAAGVGSEAAELAVGGLHNLAANTTRRLLPRPPPHRNRQLH
jgi:hypothetical protein